MTTGPHPLKPTPDFTRSNLVSVEADGSGVTSASVDKRVCIDNRISLYNSCIIAISQLYPNSG